MVNQQETICFNFTLGQRPRYVKLSKFKDIFWEDKSLNLNIIGLHYILIIINMKLSRIFRDHTLKVININLKKINYKYNIVNNIGIDEIRNNLNGINNIDIGEIIYNSLNHIKNNNDIGKENEINTNLGFI